MATKTPKKTTGRASATPAKKTAKKTAKKSAQKSAQKSAGTKDDYTRAVSRVIERAGGDDELLQRMAGSFASNNVAQVRKILAEYGGLSLSEELLREYMDRFNREHRPDAKTGEIAQT